MKQIKMKKIRKSSQKELERVRKLLQELVKPIRCPECGSTEHRASNCDNMG